MNDFIEPMVEISISDCLFIGREKGFLSDSCNVGNECYNNKQIKVAVWEV
jgi:hypothetical protein